MRKHQLLHQHFNRDKSPPFPGKAATQNVNQMKKTVTALPITAITAPVQVGVTIGRTVPAGEMSREELFKYVTDGFQVKDGTDMCFQEQLNRNIFLEYLMESRIGSGSINGEAYKVCTPFVCTDQGCQCTEHTVHVAIKLVPISYEAWKLKERAQATPHSQQLIVNNHIKFEEGMKVYEVWAELTAMTLANALVQQAVCPNLPLLFHWFICDSCNFKNEELLNNQYDYPTKNKYIDTIRKAQQGRVALKDPSLITPCAIIMNELANGGDLQSWCNNRMLQPGAAQSMMFQIVAGLYAIRKYYGMHHNDMHAGNVLVHILPPSHSGGAGGVFKYRIDGRDYYVPHHGFLFVLWDFGYATIVNGPNGANLHSMTLDSYDSIPTKGCGDMERISDVLRDYYMGENLDDDDPEGFLVGDHEDAATIDMLAIPGRFTNYGQVFQDVFVPIFSKPLQNVQSEWNMDKPLQPFADADLNLFIRDVNVDQANKQEFHPMCQACGTVADPGDRFCAECANPLNVAVENTDEDDETTVDSVSKRLKFVT